MMPGETILSGATSQREDPRISNFMVLKSGGGYYVGTLYNNDEGWQEPNSRETDYFDTKEEAERALSLFNETGVLPKQR